MPPLFLAAGAWAILAVVTAGSSLVDADEIVLPQVLPNDRPIMATYRLDQPRTGSGSLLILWRDAAGRVIERHRLEFALAKQTDVPFPLDMRRAAMPNNRVEVRLSLSGTANGKAYRRESDAVASFVVPPAGDPWSTVQIIMWQPQTAPAWRTLASIGVSGGEIVANREHPGEIDHEAADALLANGLRWYVENIATDFYSAYHRWYPDRPVNWRFAAVQKLYRDDPGNPVAFARDPGLDDPVWLGRIAARLDETVRTYRRYAPLYYDLGDEPGIADLASDWDFDRSARSLAGMRRWLATKYSDLAALNAEWGTNFRDWRDVMPMTTAAAVSQPSENFASWADFKAWMDVSFARALALGADAIHRADPRALAAIEGGQRPGTGGYDYARLAKVLDAIEVYDDGSNFDMIRSFNPRIVLLTTSSGSGAVEEHRIWRNWLRGMRGLILWDPQHRFVRPDGSLGERGSEDASYFRELRGGLGAALVASARQYDPVAILSSSASMRTQWILDRRREGDDAWSRRDSEAEWEDVNVRDAVRDAQRLLALLGITPRFVSSDQVEHGILGERSIRVLVLPHAIALSDRETAAIRRFAENGGTIVADVEPGMFDGHSRLRTAPPLADLFAAGRARRITGASNAALTAMRGVISGAGALPPFAITHADGTPVQDVETYRYRNGRITLVALQRMLASESAVAASSEQAVLALPFPAVVYDIRRRRMLGRRSRVQVEIDPVTPTVLAIFAAAPQAPVIAGPARASTGETAMLRVSVPGSAAAADILRIEVSDPSGKLAPYYSGILRAPRGSVLWRLPLAINDPPGRWTAMATDVLTGQSGRTAIMVTRSQAQP